MIKLIVCNEKGKLSERIIGEVKGYPIHYLHMIQSINKKLRCGEVEEIIIKKSDTKKQYSKETELELSTINTLEMRIKRLLKNEKHSKEELRNVLHNCLIYLEELKAIKVD